MATKIRLCDRLRHLKIEHEHDHVFRFTSFRFHNSGGNMPDLRKITAALVLGVLLFPVSALAQRMKVGYWTSGFSLGFGAVMEQMKFAENQGLNVEWVKSAGVNGPT